MILKRKLLVAMASAGMLGAMPSPEPPAHVDVGLEAILQDPIAYNDRAVRTRGFLVLQFEGNALWASEYDYRAHRYHRAVWLDFPYATTDFDALSGKRVLVSGVVSGDADHYGHYGMWPAEIGEIQAIAMDPSDTDRPRPWINDPLVVILASLSFLGLFFGAWVLSEHARPTVQPPRF